MAVAAVGGATSTRGTARPRLQLTRMLTVASTLLALFTSLTSPELLVIYGATIIGAWFFALLLGLAQVAGAQSNRRTWRAVGGFYLAGAMTLAVVLIDVGV